MMAIIIIRLCDLYLLCFYRLEMALRCRNSTTGLIGQNMLNAIKSVLNYLAGAMNMTLLPKLFIPMINGLSILAFSTISFKIIGSPKTKIKHIMNNNTSTTFISY